MQHSERNTSFYSYYMQTDNVHGAAILVDPTCVSTSAVTTACWKLEEHSD